MGKIDDQKKLQECLFIMGQDTKGVWVSVVC
jgi:hypothetical protein